ncbi:MAG: AAA family ATPase [Bacteroidales bacterium]|nr:AAA family ATPase [Bacteroidales bacterium]
MGLTLEQDNAMRILLDRHNDKEKISVLQGIAGSGKSFLLSYLIQHLGYEENEVAFATYTGTAAKILMKQGLNASTIHQLIYTPIIRRGICVGFRKKFTEDLLGLKLIIIDEFSMVPQNILTDLLSYHIPIIFVGDQAQLPPIGEPNKLIHTAHAILTEPMRQALDNPILWAANEVRLGNHLPYGLHGNILFVGAKSNLKEEWLRPEVKILVGLNATRNTLNLQMSGSAIPLTGHKIIFLKNDWQTFITNGTVGEILSLEKKGFTNYKLKILLDDESTIIEDYVADFQKQSKPNKQFFDFAYAITCHRAQGATYDNPGLIFDESSVFKENKYKWLYSALTRFTGNSNVAILR